MTGDQTCSTTNPSSERSTDSDTPTPSTSPPSGSENTSPPNTPLSPSPTAKTDQSSSSPDSPHPTPPTNQQLDIPLIHDDPDAANRLSIDPDNLKMLADSIATHGLLNPITVREEIDRYTLVAGRRRLAAFKLLGRPTIPATVIKTTDHGALEIKLAENVARSQLTPVEEMMQLAKLLGATPGGVDEVAHAIGRSVNWVLDRLDLADYPEALLGHIHERRISLAAAKHLARITPLEIRDEYITQASRNGINASTASLWRQQTEQAPGQPMTDEQTHQLRSYPETTTETRLNCFACREFHLLENTQPVRICQTCLAEIHAQTTQ